VEVKISVDSDGLRISRPSQDQPAAAQPKVQIDENGVRIEADRHGRKVVIDRHGVSVEEAAPKAGAEGPKSPAASGSDKAAEGSGSAKVTVPPGVINDPEKVAKAVEAAKEQIEQIVQEQVDRKVERLKTDRPDEPSRWPDVADWVLMLVFAMLIMKIALGSKRRAESRAEAADAAAAEEGLKRQLAEAQLKTMQAQVEPHFLFNTLASVDYLIETDPARASRMQKNLIQYLRAALPQMRQASSTLGQEMAQCRSYLEILKVRMDDRLQFAITMPAGLSTAAFPPMMLQTLVENSIKHGLEPKPEGGVLTLSADVVNGNLRVVVSDTGLGFGAAGSGGGGVGLNNVRERLQALFGARGRLTIEANSPSGTIATIQVPYTVGVAEPAPQSSPQPA
jgi:chemotaxis protein histidine kinase CheA